MGYVNINVDLDYIYDDLSSFDKRELAEWLENDGYCTLEREDFVDREEEFIIENPNHFDDEWTDMCKKIFHSRLNISQEDENKLKEISNKL
jgi:hypothetical protein